jgi:hypothetical protein
MSDAQLPPDERAMEHESLFGRERRTRRRGTAREDDDVIESEYNKALATQVFWFCLAMMFLPRLAITALELPLLRLVERTICKAYLGTDIGGIDEQACKIPVVQDKVAKIMGYRTTFDALPCRADTIQICLLLLISAFRRPPDCFRVWVVLKSPRETICDYACAHRSILSLDLDFVAR